MRLVEKTLSFLCLIMGVLRFLFCILLHFLFEYLLTLGPIQMSLVYVFIFFILIYHFDCSIILYSHPFQFYVKLKYLYCPENPEFLLFSSLLLRLSMGCAHVQGSIDEPTAGTTIIGCPAARHPHQKGMLMLFKSQSLRRAFSPRLGLLKFLPKNIL